MAFHNVRVQGIIEQIAFASKYTVRLLAHTPMEDWFQQPAGGVSYVAGQVGHLALGQYRLALERIRGPRPGDHEPIPPDRLRRFGATSVPAWDPKIYPAAPEIRAVFGKVHEDVLRELHELGPGELDEPVLRAHPLAKTKQWSVIGCAQHEADHAGQIGPLRGQLGRPPL